MLEDIIIYGSIEDVPAYTVITADLCANGGIILHGPLIQVDWAQTDASKYDYIKNKQLVEDRIKQNEDDIDKLQSDVAEHTERLDGIDEEIEAVNGDIEEINGNIEAIGKDIEDIDTDIETINGNITDINTHLDTADKAIDAAQKSADAAKAAADAAESDASAAQSTADKAVSDAKAAKNAADAAQTTANKGVSDAAAAKTAANNAASAANNAQTTANNAAAAASTAQATASNAATAASKAQSTADSAKTAANNAATAASNAQETADAAKTAAGIAQTTANSAKETAESVQTAIKSKSEGGNFAAVAFSGAYEDLSGTPTIPEAANNGKLTIKVGDDSYEFTANQAGDTDVEIDAGGLKTIEGSISVDVTSSTPVFTVTGLDDVKEKGVYAFFNAVSDISSQFTSIVTVDSVNGAIVQYIHILPYYWKMLSIQSVNVDTDFIYRQYTGDSWGAWTVNQAIVPSSRIDGLSNKTITITQGGVEKGSFTLNQSTDGTIEIDEGGSENMIVTITKSDDTYSTDTNSAQIAEAFNNHTCVYAYYGSMLYQLQTIVNAAGTYIAVFVRVSSTYIQTFSIRGTQVGYSEQAVVTTTDLSKKADKVTGTEDHLTSLDANGGYQDSGYFFGDAQSSTESTVSYALSADLALKADKIYVSNETETTKAIDPNKYYKWGEVATLDITLNEPSDTTIVNEYMFGFTSGSSATTLTIPSTMPDGTAIKWNAAPSISSNKSYQVSIVDGIAIIVAGND